MLATFGYDDLRRRTSLTQGNGTVTSYGYDPVSRLSTLTQNLPGTANDQSSTFSFNPASQIGGVTRTNDAYAWTGHGSGSTAGVANGLNQLTSIGGAATSHDSKGNLTADPATGKSYSYSSENLLTGSTGGTAATLSYDPLLRLYQFAGASTLRFAYDGVEPIAEYDGGGTLQSRYVFGPGTDEPLVRYNGAGTRTWYTADERGSITTLSDDSGTVSTINRYDEFGKPQSTNAGRFQYTGQMWLPELAAYYYKARIYSPSLGRFLQPDPIGYKISPNLYSYARIDPINFFDPTGLCPVTIIWEVFHDIGTKKGEVDDKDEFVGLEYEVGDDGSDRCGVSLLGDTVERLKGGLQTRIKELYCSLPAFGLSFAARGYDVAGGGFTTDFGFDPKSGRIGGSMGIDDGLGFGAAGKFTKGSGASGTGGRNVPNGWSGSIGVNANAQVGPIAVGTGATLIGQRGPGFNGVSGGLRPGGGLTINANIGARVGYGDQILPACGSQ